VVKNNEYFGEALASSIHLISGECYALDGLPAYGQAVIAESSLPAVALISELRVGSALPGRSLTKRGLDPVELTAKYPEIEELIAAEFEAVVIGQLSGDIVSLRPPSRPVPLYTQLRAASPAEIVALTLAENLISRLFRAAAGDDNLLVAVISNLALELEDKAGFLDKAARELAALLTEDYPRLEYLLKDITRIQQ
jgi:hypothetical protein